MENQLINLRKLNVIDCLNCSYSTLYSYWKTNIDGEQCPFCDHKMILDLVYEALMFASEKHKNQKRKYTGEPYIVHPLNVARIVGSVTYDKKMEAAAWLHDTIEDTDTTIEEIEIKFGIIVARLVDELTNKSKLSESNREKRKQMDRDRISLISKKAKTIKLADLLDNIPSIIKHDPGFARVYLKEKKELLGVLKEGNQQLYRKVKLIIENYFKEIQ